MTCGKQDINGYDSFNKLLYFILINKA